MPLAHTHSVHLVARCLHKDHLYFAPTKLRWNVFEDLKRNRVYRHARFTPLPLDKRSTGKTPPWGKNPTRYPYLLDFLF